MTTREAELFDELRKKATSLKEGYPWETDTELLELRQELKARAK